MIVTLDTEASANAEAFLAYTGQGREVLRGLLRDALLVAALSPPRAPELRREVLRANVPHTAETVPLDYETLPPGDHVAQAAARVLDLARSLDVPPEQAMHGAVRCGLAILAPPAELLPPTFRKAN